MREYYIKIDRKITSIFVCLKLLKKDDSPLLKYSVFAWLIFLLIIMISGLLDVGFLWQKEAVGWEYLWIAENIEKGHGFSYLDCSRWGFAFGPIEGCSNNYFPTATEEPIYPILLVLASKFFGDYGRFFVLVLQVLALFFTSISMYCLSRKLFNAPTGILAGSILPFIPGVGHFASLTYAPSIFVGLMIVISAYLILSCIEKGSVHRGIILGLTLGFNSLLYASTILFIPITVFSLIIIKSSSTRLIAYKTALTVLLTAIIVLSAWTIRNYSVFEQFVPVRTGLGFNVHHGNPTLAEWSASKSSPGTNDSGFFSKIMSAKKAIDHFKKNDQNRIAMYKLSHEMILKDAPKGYESYNAAERDRFHFNKGLEFILSQPQTFIALTLYKMYVYIFYFHWSIEIISLLCIITVMITLNSWKTRILVLLILSLAGPFFLSVAWFYRYRYPIEPLTLLFASYLPVLIFSNLHSRIKNYNAS